MELRIEVDMDASGLSAKLARGESSTVEFKRCGSSPGPDTFETICALANHAGGDVFLGVDDGGAVLGVGEGAALGIQRNVANVTRNPELFDPAVAVETEAVEIGGKTVVRVRVPMSPDVHRYKGVVYDRVADADVSVTAGQRVSDLYIRKSGVGSERRVFPYLGIGDLRPDLLQRARDMASSRRPGHPWSGLGDEALLRSAQLLVRDYGTGEEGLTLAAGLLFGPDEVIGSLCPAYKTDAVVRLRDADRYDDRLVVRTNLLDAYGLLMGFCERHLPDPFHLEGDARVSVRAVVCRELVSNLLIHREFASPLPARLVIDGGGLHTENASRGWFEGEITLSNLSPIPKNPAIANVFAQVGLAEELGSGTRNLYRYSRRFLGADPQLADGPVFRALIPDARGVLAGGGRGPGIDEAIMALARSGAPFTVGDAAGAAGVTKRSASSHLSALVGRGLLAAEGSTRDRRYRLAQDS